ncbi:hypothetical protein PHPALM_2563 [Phytophthora palmivora]|uniref:Uncharacterized protein n=1 Tax=Phytophthora palmivora TaxID=4796 RepID=A0A2P4YPI8_9STRA|nr:hypothetical protein PHPALM_2563 [Phytophthora palmivora]
MESLYARDTPTPHERKLKLAERDQILAVQGEDQATAANSSQQEPTETLESLMETSTEVNTEAATSTDSTSNSTDDAFGFSFSSLPRDELEEPQSQLDEQWRATQAADLGTGDGKLQQETQETANKTEEGRLAELSGDLSTSDNIETKTMETVQTTQDPPIAIESTQPRRVGVASVPRKSKPAITINTGSGSGVGTKRPPPTPVSPPIFSWNDILREQANVAPAFTNVVWQKLEEQNPTFFRAYSLQLQLKEQIIAFNYLV